MTTKYKTLTELDEEALRLRRAGEMSYEKFKELFFNGVELGFSDDDMDFMIGASGGDLYKRLVRETAAKAKPA